MSCMTEKIHWYKKNTKKIEKEKRNENTLWLKIFSFSLKIED